MRLNTAPLRDSETPEKTPRLSPSLFMEDFRVQVARAPFCMSLSMSNVVTCRWCDASCSTAGWLTEWYSWNMGHRGSHFLDSIAGYRLGCFGSGVGIGVGSGYFSIFSCGVRASCTTSAVNFAATGLALF